MLVNGAPHAGARFEVFDAGGLTPRASYTTAALTTLHDPANIRSDAQGRCPAIWVQGSAYKVRVSTSSGVSIFEDDDLPGDTASSGGGGGSATGLFTGLVLDYYGTGRPTGWVRLNGRTIGSALSSASELAHADAEPLFLHLWAVDSSLTVSSGRGATAAADWAANKQLTLPDGRFAALIGLDGMGNTTAGRSSGLTFTAGTADTLGFIVGSATVSLSTSQLPSHDHTGTTNAAGQHAHTGTTYADGGHTPTGTANAGGSSSHIVYVPTTDSVFALGVYSGVSGGAFSTTAINVPVHTHTLSMDAVPNHSHGFATGYVADHQHGFTTATTGGGGAHSNQQYSIGVTKIMKL